MRTRIELFVDKGGSHRWRKKAANFVITGASTQGYATQRGAIKNLEAEQGGWFHRDRVRLLDGEQPFTRGKRRSGVLRRPDGKEFVVLELENLND